MFKKFCGALILLGICQAASAYSLLGPYEGYQVPAIGYNVGGDIGAPKNLGSEYRWNTPVLYYSYDESFKTYFRSNGMKAINLAIEQINNLTNFSSYSPELSEFPLDTTRFNYQAQALGLIDLKSVALNVILEELGLADPDRFVWTLRGRFQQPGNLPCPFMYYAVEMRNYDPISNSYSPYINGTLWSYYILEGCTTSPTLAVTVPFPVDPTAVVGTAVASIDGTYNTPANFGLFYNGLSRDDVAGLRYLMATNNANVETVSDDSLQFVTNRFSQLLVTTNLATLIAQSLTNDPVALSNLYPGLVINSVSNFFTNVITTNFTAYFTNGAFSQAFTPATLVLVTNKTTNAATRFIYKFGNVVTNTYFTKGFVTIVDTTVGPNGTWTVSGSPLKTNVTIKTVLTNMPNGTFFLLPTNACGVQILSTQLVNLVTFTNTIPALTNLPGITNINGQGFARDVITYATNYSFVYYPILCVTNTVDKREGMDRIKFIEVNADPVTGRFPTPITNIFTLTSVNQTNPQPIVQVFRRVVTSPDWLFATEEDITTGPVMGTEYLFREEPRYTVPPGTVTNTVAGPGILQGPIWFIFNETGPLIMNFYDTNSFLNGLSQASGNTNYAWGSFDATTNAPIVYPEGNSITNLDSMVYFSIATTILPDGQVGIAYTTQLQVIGGSDPHVWSLNPSSAGLPDGLTLSTDGIISGTPTIDGTFDFTVDVTEASGRTTTRDLTIVITP